MQIKFWKLDLMSFLHDRFFQSRYCCAAVIVCNTTLFVMFSSHTTTTIEFHIFHVFSFYAKETLNITLL